MTLHEPAVYACSPGDKLYPGLHQEKSDQQVEGGGSALLLCTHETPPGVLSHFWGSLQEGYQAIPCGDRLRAKALQPVEEKTPTRPYSSLPVTEGGLQENWEGTFYKDM